MSTRARTGRFRPKGWLDRVFEVGIVLKGLDGVAELVGALLLVVIGPTGLHRWAAVLTQGELSEDPGDVVARYLLRTSAGLDGHAVLFGAAYLLVHGLVKVVLVVALLRNRLWAYPWMIGVLLAFIAYQLYRIALSPSAGMTALTVFDVLVVALTWREWRLQKAARRAGADDAAQADGTADDQRSTVG